MAARAEGCMMGEGMHSQGILLSIFCYIFFAMPVAAFSIICKIIKLTVTANTMTMRIIMKGAEGILKVD